MSDWAAGLPPSPERRLFTLTTYPDTYDPHGATVSLSWDELAKAVTEPATPNPGGKDFQRMLSAASYGTGEVVRADAGVVSLSCVVLDVDNGGTVQVSLNDLERALHGLSYAIHTTWSSTPERLKCHVWVPCSRDVTAGEYAQVWHAFVNGRLADVRQAIDTAPSDRSRGFYAPTQRPGYVSRIGRGELLDVDHELVQAGPIDPDPPRSMWNAETVTEGGRNVHLTSRCGLLRKAGLEGEAMLHALQAVNQLQCEPPLSIGEVRKIAESADRWAADPVVEQLQVVLDGELFVDFETLVAEAQAPDWLIDGVLERDSLALLYGDYGSGKSYAAIDMGLSIATGREWFGHTVWSPGPVLYLCGEGHNGIGRRLRAWKQHHGIEGDVPFYVSRCAAQLSEMSNALGVERAIEKLVEQIGVAPSLVEVDTLQRNFGPGNENTTEDMSRFLSHCDRFIRQRFDCGVLLVHHTGHGDKDRARGSSALGATVDTEFQLAKTAEGHAVLSCKKQRNAVVGADIAMMLAPVTLDGLVDRKGDAVTDAVVTKAIEIELDKKPAASQGKNQAAIMDVLGAYGEAGVARPTLREACVKAGLDRVAFNRALKRLVELGVVAVDGTKVVKL